MPKAKCPTCATVVTYAAGYDPICPNCGFRGAAPAAPPPPPAQWAQAQSPPQPPYGAPPAGYAAPPAYAPQGREQGMAVGALVVGLLSLFFMWIPFFGALVGILAAILGGVAMGQADREPQRYGGKGMATAGLVLGIITAAFAILFWGFVFEVFDDW